MKNLLFKVVSPQELKDMLPVQMWWEVMMVREPHMLYEPTSKLLRTVVKVIVVFDGQKIVAASGVFFARTKTGEYLYHRSQMVVEIGSIVVDPDYRNIGIGRKLTSECLNLSWQQGLLPVSISTNSVMQRIFQKLGGRSMDDMSELEGLRESLCICASSDPNCKLCPLAKNGGWIFWKNCEPYRPPISSMF